MAFNLWLFVSVVAFSFLFHYLYWKPRRLYNAMAKQGIGGHWLFVLGILKELHDERKKRMKINKNEQCSLDEIQDSITHAVTKRFMKEYGRVYVFSIGPFPRLKVVEPEYVRDILVTKANCYNKSPLMKAILSRILGEGLLLSEGDFWKTQRRLISPAFHFQFMKPMVALMRERTDIRIAKWGSTDGPVQAHEEMSALALDIIGGAAFGSQALDHSEIASNIFRAIKFSLQVGQKQISTNPFALIPGADKIPLPSLRKTGKYLNFIRTTVGSLIQERQAGESKSVLKTGKDLLDLLLESRYDNGTAMKNELVLDESLTFALAGHETTANLMVWALYLLTQHQDIYEKCIDEVRDVVGLEVDQDRPNWDDLKNLQYIDAVLSEALRLFPPVPALERVAVQDHILGENGRRLEIKKGTTVNISIYFLHRDERYWKNPDLFDPTRFLKEYQHLHPKRHPACYLPFSLGPRACIGFNFAQLEAKVILCRILQRYEFKLSAGQKIVPEAFITLRSSDGLLLDVKSR